MSRSVSTASESRWDGDVHDGVRAWVGDREPTGPPPDPEAESPEPDQEQVARTILLDQLTRRARSRAELAEQLRRRNVPDELVDRLLDRFEDVGLVDDEAFARMWVEGRQRSRGLARRALAQELRRKGVADDTAREVLDEVDPGEEEATARQLVRRKLRSVRHVDDAKATRRLAGMLARKGYPAGLAFAVVRDELAAAGRDAEIDGGVEE